MRPRHPPPCMALATGWRSVACPPSRTQFHPRQSSIIHHPTESRCRCTRWPYRRGGRPPTGGSIEMGRMGRMGRKQPAVRASFAACASFSLFPFPFSRFPFPRRSSSGVTRADPSLGPPHRATEFGKGERQSHVP